MTPCCLHAPFIAILSFLLATIIPALGAPPLNDNFAAAQEILRWDEWVVGDNSEATSERREPRVVPRSHRATVWYFWDPPADGYLRIDLDSATFGGYPVMAVFTGNNIGSLSRVPLGLEHRTYYYWGFRLKAGFRYWIALDTFGERGDVRIRGDFTTLHIQGLTNGQPVLQSESTVFEMTEPVPDVDGTITNVSYIAYAENFVEVTLGESPTPPFIVTATNLPSGTVTVVARAINTLGQARLSTPLTLKVRPANDDFSNAAIIVGYEFSVWGTTDQATAERGEPLHGGSKNSRWWKWTAPAAGEVRIFEEFSRSKYGFAIYTGESITSLKRVPTRRKGNWTSFEVTAGTTYRIAVAPRNAKQPASFYLYGSIQSVRFTSPADGRSFTEAEPIPVAVNITEDPTDVERVEFLVGTALVGVSRNPPFSSTWTNATPGRHCISARLIRRDGLVSPVPETCIVVTPGNDDFENAFPIETNLSTVIAWLGHASIQPNEPLAALSDIYRTLWWSFRAPEDGILVLAPSSDVSLGVFTGEAVEALTSHITSFSGAKMQANVIKGVTYRICIGSGYYNTYATCRVQYYEAPSNDHFSSRTVITGNSNILHALFVGATIEADEPPVAFSATNTLWWTWTAPTAGRLSLSVLEGDFSWLEVFHGSSLTTLSPADSLEYRPITNGQVFQFRIADNAAYREDASVSFIFSPTPANDSFALRFPVSNTNEVIPANSFAATSEPGEPSHSPYGSLRSLWWTWRAPADGEVWLQQENGTAIFAVYRGESLAELVPVKVARAYARFHVVAGEAYQIAVDTGDSRPDSGDWRLLYWAAPPNDQFSASATLGAGTNSLTFDLMGGSREAGEPLLASNEARSVWFTWRATETTDILFAAPGGLVGVFIGTDLTNLIPVGSRNYEDAILLNAVAGQEYRIKVAENSPFYQLPLLVTLLVKPYTRPLNDHFSSATRIVDVEGQMTTENWGATVQPGELVNGFYPVRRTLWFRWITPGPGWLTLRQHTNAPALSFRIFLGTNIGGLADLGRNIGAIQIPVAANEDLKFQIDHYYTSGGLIDFHYKFEPAPPNDEFEHATILPGAPASLEGNTRWATTEAQPYNTFARFSDRDLWWRWTAAEDGVAVLSNNFAHVQNRVYLYAGTNRTTRVLLTTNWSNTEISPVIAFTAFAGTVYNFRLSAFHTDELNWSLSFMPAGRALTPRKEASNSFVLEVSTDLKEWTSLATNNAAQDLEGVLRSRTMNHPKEFLRQRVLRKTPR